jgi:hypothetical protein
MKRPSTSAVVAFVVVLLVTALIVGVVGWGTDGATAIRVGDESVSAETVNRELSQWADFEQANARSTNGALTSRAGTTITTQIVYQLLIEQYLDRKGEQVTAADRANARDAVAQSPEFAKLPESFRERFLGRQSTFNALTRLVGVDDQGTAELQLLQREARRTDVTVDPAYGRWAPARALVVQYPKPFTPSGQG